MEIPFENPCPGQANGLSSYYFTQAVHMLLASHCMLGNPEDYPINVKNSSLEDYEFDFIIVGGGSSGSVIANRLSEIKKWKILLIEAGGNPTFESDIPFFSLSLPGRELDWKFTTKKSKTFCQGMEDETCVIFQGKVLGGTSTINKMHYLRGNPQDYDEWENLGNKGWSYDKVLPYFKKSENLDDDFTIVKEEEFEKNLKKAAIDDEREHLQLSKMMVGKYHSKAGILSVNHFAYSSFFSKINKGIFAAAKKLNISYISDFNGKKQIGFSRVLGTIHEGNRGNSAKAFLTPIKTRKNLFVLKSTVVEELVIEGNKVTGVKFSQNGETKTVSAKKEVILSAGAINSPKLLLLSGIGPKKHLEQVGIKVIHDLPGVGENLQLHFSFFGFPVVLDKDKCQPVSHLQKIDAMYQFISRGVGLFGGIGLNEVVGFVNSENNSSLPDIQFLHYFNHVKDYYTLNELFISLRIKNEIRDQFARAYSTANLLLISPTLLRPKSRGKVELTVSNFKQPLRIFYDYLKIHEDINILLKGIKLGIQLIETDVFQKFEPDLLKLEIDGCKNFKFKTDEYWECLVRHMTSSMHDAAGTCKMGPVEDTLAVVDSNLRVHGIKGLRIADSSIMPVIIRGSTSVASVMIGEKVSDLIKNDWSVKHEEL